MASNTAHQNSKGKQPQHTINYKTLEQKNEWLDKHAFEVKDIFGLEFSNTFEQIEQMVKEKYEEGKDEDDNRDEGDTLGSKERDNAGLRKKDGYGYEHNTNPPVFDMGKNQKPNYFDCDVSEIPANR